MILYHIWYVSVPTRKEILPVISEMVGSGARREANVEIAVQQLAPRVFIFRRTVSFSSLDFKAFLL